MAKAPKDSWRYRKDAIQAATRWRHDRNFRESDLMHLEKRMPEEFLDLKVQTRSIVIDTLGHTSKASLRAQMQHPDGMLQLIRTKGIGKKTLKELMDWAGFGKWEKK